MRCAIKPCKQDIIVTDAPSIFPVVKAHVDELSSARIWQHKLYATLPPNVNINCRLFHQGMHPIVVVLSYISE